MKFLHGDVAFEFGCDMGDDDWEFRLYLLRKPERLVMSAVMGGEVVVHTAARKHISADLLPSLANAFQEKVRAAESSLRNIHKIARG